MKVKTVSVQLDKSTYRWLAALAQANSKTQLNPGSVTIGELLARAAFCFADYAGRRDGSWEADAGRNLLVAAGYQQLPSYGRQQQLAKWEEQKRRAWLASQKKAWLASQKKGAA